MKQSSIQQYLRSFLAFGIVTMLCGTIEYVLIQGKTISDSSSLMEAFFNFWWIFLLLWIGDIYQISKTKETLLRKAIESEDEQSLIKWLASEKTRKIDPGQYHLIEKALAGRWHSQHEDLVDVVSLEGCKDDRFVEPILNIALNRKIYRWYDDDLESTLRKCVHALKAIDTVKSNAALDKLKGLNNDNVRHALAMYNE